MSKFDKIKKNIKNNINSYNKHYVDLEEKDNTLVFHLRNPIRFSKNFLIIKHRHTGRRIIKEFVKSKVEISASDLFELDILGVFDAYLQVNVFNSEFFKKIKFNYQNYGKMLNDSENQRIFYPYQTLGFTLSFKYFENPISTRITDFKLENNKVLLKGKIELLEDLEFDSIEILVDLMNSRNTFPCEYSKEGNIITFSTELDFTVDEDEIEINHRIYIRLKDGEIIVAFNQLKWISDDDIKTIDDKYLGTIDNFQFKVEEEDDNEYGDYDDEEEEEEPKDYTEDDICTLFYVYVDYNLKFITINKKDIKKKIHNEKVSTEFNSVRRNKPFVFLESFNGEAYSGQPKYIYEKMLEMGMDKDYNFVWSYDGDYEIPGNALITKRDAFEYFDLLRKSKYWISNINFPYMKENKRTIYIQTTHGTPYKHMGADIETNSTNIARGNVLKESDTWNYLLSPNDFATEIFRKSFEYEGEVIDKGYPANDIFYKDTSKKKRKILEELNIDSNKKIILYAPTFRDYEKNDKNERDFNFPLELKKLYDNLAEDHILIVRLHYLVAKDLELDDDMGDFVIDLSDYEDIADLYLISDIMITDYSSAFFDYAHSKKPILFFVPDFEQYSSFRGLYTEVRDSLPGPEIYTNDELIENIRNIESVEKEYENKYNKFYDEFCGYGHGTAAEDVVNIIFRGAKNE